MTANVKDKVYTALNSISAFGSRCYPNTLPEQPTYPCVSYQMIANPPAPGYIAAARKSQFNVQVIPRSRDVEELFDLRTSIINAFEAMPEHIVRSADIEAPFEFETRTFSWILTFVLQDTEQ